MLHFDTDRSFPSPSDGFRFFRDIDLQTAVSAVPQSIRTVILDKAQRWLTYDFPVIPASTYMLTRRNGNRYNYEILLVDRWMAMFDLLSAELITQKGTYIDKLMDVVWMNCEMSTWTIQSHTNYQLPTVDGSTYDWLELFSAEMGALIGWCYYFFKDEFEKRVPTVFNARIVYELRHRMLDNFMENAKVGDGRWRWFFAGGNWNIWIMTNILSVAGAIVTDAAEMDRIVKKVLSSAQVYLDTFPKDGICPEGPRYWSLSSGALIDLVEMLYDLSDGKVDYLQHPLVKAMLEYNFYFIKPGTVTFNFGDAEICLAADAIFLRRIAKRIGYDEMERYAASLYNDAHSSYLHMTANYYRKLRDLFCSAITEEPAEPYEPPYPRYMESLHTYFDKTIEAPLYLALKAHTNGDPHGHVDTGSYIVYRGEQPVLIDPGLDCYSTFNWNYTKTQYRNAGWHNTMLFNGHAEAGGGQFAAREQRYEPESRTFSCELSGTFVPSAQVYTWVRTWRCQQTQLYVTDTWEIGGEGTAEMVLMTRHKPRIVTEEQKIVLDAIGTTIAYDPIFTPRVELMDESGSLNSPEILAERQTRLDFYRVAPRLPYEKPTVIPYPSSLQWGQPYLYRIVLRAQAHKASCTTVIG